MKTAIKQAAIVLATAAAMAGTARAQDAVPSLSDLVYQDTAWGRGELYKRGYVQQSNAGGGYENWWNAAARQCVTLRSERGKVASVVGSPAIDCGHGGGAAPASSSGNAAALIGAAAILGVAAMAHKSHHHDDQRHAAGVDQEAQFERGYRDGMYHQPYDTYGDDAYERGYASGSRERDAQTSYRGYSPSGGTQVTCESIGSQRVECPMDTRGSVRVLRQLSHAPCVDGQTWGLSKHAVWVEGGCRAVFAKD